MSTTVDPAGTPFPSAGPDRDDATRGVDIYDLALAGARFVLERAPDARRPGGTPTESGRDTLRSTVSALAARRSLLDLPPMWARAGESLIRGGEISAADLEALLATRAQGESLGQLLLRSTDLPEGVVAETLARATTAPLLSLTTYPVHGEPFRSPEEAVAAPKHPVLVDELAARRIPRELSERHDVLVVAAWEHEGVLAMVDPGDEAALWEAQETTGLRLTRFTALASQLRLAVERCWQPRPDVIVPATGSPRDALPFMTSVGVPALVLMGLFLFVFRDALNLRHHFALAALACGIFFFSYALRYYITTAAVVGTVLFGDRLRRNRLISRIRAAQSGDRRKLTLDAIADSVAGGGGGAAGRKRHDYKTLRGERLDDIGAIVTADPERIGMHRLPRDRQPFISVHLAMYNERTVVDRLLRACTSFDYDNYEVIVADDSTDPQALALLDKWASDPRVRILHRPTRKGFKGGALQEALKVMDERTEYVMIFDADFIPPPDAVWHFLDYFGRLPGPAGENGHGYHAGDLRGTATGTPTNGDRLAAVQGYQWHMLNASENWITKGIRTEFSGSYVLERAAQELFGTMKMISGSVYMIRADVLRRLGWSTSITEDWELTIRLYLAGYKVLYTPYIQAPSECVSRIKQLIRQRMRWARGHTFNVKRYFFPVLRSPNMTWREKAEFLYYAPYYLQSILFLVGTVAWVLGIFLLGQRLPQWGEALGWSLVVSNVLALPLMNLSGLVLEGSVKRDIVGLGSFIGLSTLLVPFQGWAALRGLLEPTEGGWDRTPKSGRITEAVGALRLGRLLPWELPRRRKMSTRTAHILVTCLAGFLAGTIVTIGALSIRAAASSTALTEGDLVLPFVFGTVVPLAIVAYGWIKLNRRIAVCVLAAAIGLSSNVVFLAATIPANATAGTSSTFMFKRTGAFDPPRYDMEQGYVPSGSATQCGNYVDPSYRSSTTVGSDFLTSVAPAKPTGTATDDILVAGLYLEEPAGTVTAPSGWTLLTSVTQTGSTPDYILRVYWKRATASEPASYTWSWPTSQWAAVFVAAYSGAYTAGDPFDAFGGTANATQTAQPVTPSITTSVADTTLLAIFGNWTSTTYTAGSGMTERVDYNTLYLQDDKQGTAGSTGTKTTTASVADWGTGILAALKGARTDLGNNWLCTWASDTFTSTMSMSSGSATVDLYGENNVAGVITYVDMGTVATGGSGNATPGLPTGWQQNDLFILTLQTDDNVVSTVSGWTSLFEVNNGTGSRASVFYKIAGASESAPTVSHTGGNTIITRIVAFRGVDTSNPIDAWGQAAGTVASEITAPSITTSVPNTMLVLTAHIGDNWGGVTWPGSFAEAYYTKTASGNDAGLGLARLEVAAAGSQAAQTITLSGTGNTTIARNAAQIALRPATRNCTITATLKHVSGTTTTLGSGTGTFASPSSTSGTLVQITFSTTAVTFADLDRLHLEVSAPSDATNCNARIHFDGVSQQSKLVTATIVPEGLLGLLLLAPILPVAIRRRWVLIPWLRVRDRRVPARGPRVPSGGPEAR